MSDKKKNTNPSSPKFKFNMYWVYGIIFIAFIGISFLNDGALSTRKISTNKFFKILETNDVAKILIINKNIAEVFIKQESASKEEYKKYSRSPFYRKGSPMFQYNFGDLQNFENKLTEYKNKYGLDFDSDSDSRGSLLDSIIGLGSLFALSRN